MGKKQLAAAVDERFLLEFMNFSKEARLRKSELMEALIEVGIPYIRSKYQSPKEILANALLGITPLDPAQRSVEPSQPKPAIRLLSGKKSGEASSGGSSSIVASEGEGA